LGLSPKSKGEKSSTAEVAADPLPVSTPEVAADPSPPVSTPEVLPDHPLNPMPVPVAAPVNEVAVAASSEAGLSNKPMTVKEALDSIRLNTTNCFAVFGYDSQLKGFELKEGPAPGGMIGFQDAVRGKRELLFGIVRVSCSATPDQNSLIGVFYRPGGLSIKMKMKSMTFKSAIKSDSALNEVLGKVAIELDVETVDGISKEDITARLRKMGGPRQQGGDFLFS